MQRKIIGGAAKIALMLGFAFPFAASVPANDLKQLAF